jgi:hypothetical protein
MRFRSWFAIIGRMASVVAMFAAGATMRAQSGPPGPSSGPGGPSDRGFHQRMGPGSLSPDDAIGFLGVEAGLGRKTVTSAPFTAAYSQQTTQAFADGNRIQRTTTGTLSRDGSGRTRRDFTLPAMGDWAASGKTPPHLILINDPVAGADYVLEPDQKTARKFALPPDKFGKGVGGIPPPFAQERQNESTTTSLGTQMVNGVSAQGTRTTRTIPAGAIGNDKQIVIIVERWYSPDLQMNVMIKRSDPRTGDNLFQLTNIVRGEPDASLFQLPADYVVKEGGKIGMGAKERMPPPAPVQN